MDRPDIDALLIGALYGELTPADEARLAAHLESHPADKSALEGMKATRENIRASRIFDLQTEPPQAVSALLLQEAARRAPRRAPEAEARESWFHRFVRSFMAHPAMAAAAMLVLVVGVAGTLYMRNGDQYADKTVETATVQTERADNAVAQAPAVTADAQAPTGNADQGVAAGSGYAVGLAEEQQAQRGKDAEKSEATAQVERKAAPAPKATAPKPDVADGDDFAKAPAKHSKKGGYLEVTTPEPTPKEMDKNDEGGEIAAAPSYGSTATGAAAGGRAPGGAPAANAVPAAPPPPPPQVAAAQAPMDSKPIAPSKPATKTAASPPKAVAKAPAQEPTLQPQTPPGPATDSTLLAWAKGQHAAAIAKVKAGDCGAAATYAVNVKQRAPDYYAQYMAGDRQLKSCTAYINDAEMRDESQNSKSKATKRASDEPAPAPSKK